MYINDYSPQLYKQRLQFADFDKLKTVILIVK